MGRSETMKHDGNYVIRKMTRNEVDLAIDWAAFEGWNPGLHDADCFYKADPEGFFVGLLDEEPIGCISAVSYGESFGFLGLYIVKPEHRGKGFGISLWENAMDYLEGRNVGLDGVIEQQENYKKSGFQLSYRNVRYEGVGKEMTADGSQIVDLSKVPFEDLKEYDDALFPDQRHRFLKSWIEQPESSALGIMNREKLSGYGVIRKCRVGFKIGPLFADNEKFAESLFQALRGHAEEGAPIFLDTPEANPASVELAKRHGMDETFETARMYTKKDPELPLDRIFGVTTLELG